MADLTLEFCKLMLGNVTTDIELCNLLLLEPNLDILEEIGYSGVPQRETLQTVGAIIQSLWVKDQIGAYLPQMMQLESGLVACGLMAHMKNSPEIWHSFFESGNMFQTCCKLLEQLGAEVQDLDLQHFMKWITGQVPPLGFPQKINVQFVHGCQTNCRCRPTVSTCDTSLKLPVHLHSKDVMKESMFSAI